MRKKILFCLSLVTSVYFLSCTNNTIEIKEIAFYDYVYSHNLNDAFMNENSNPVFEATRLKGFLVNNTSDDITDLENNLSIICKSILTEKFIQQSKEMILKNQNSVKYEYIEIDFFRVSKELPWQIDENYIPPSHIGEGNPKDWIGSFTFDINKNEIKKYWIATRSSNIFSYGKIKKITKKQH